MMITGKKIGGKNISPVKLRYSFFLLNSSIEACYNKKSLIWAGSSELEQMTLNH